MIEIVISMFLLALLSVAFLPLLVQGFRQSSANATLAAATQLVNDEMELARSRTTCSSLAPTSYSVPNPKAITLNVVRTGVVSGSCPPTTVPPTPSAYPITVPVTVTVTRGDTGVVVSSATTLISVVSG